MADILRGEVELDFGGVTYTLKANIRALQQIEAEVGENIFPLYDRFIRSTDKGRMPDVGAKHISAVLYHMIKQGGSELDRNQIEDMIDRSDLSTMCMVCRTLLNVALSDGKQRGKMGAAVKEMFHELLKASTGEAS